MCRRPTVRRGCGVGNPRTARCRRPTVGRRCGVRDPRTARDRIWHDATDSVTARGWETSLTQPSTSFRQRRRCRRPTVGRRGGVGDPRTARGTTRQILSRRGGGKRLSPSQVPASGGGAGDLRSTTVRGRRPAHSAHDATDSVTARGGKRLSPSRRVGDPRTARGRATVRGRRPAHSADPRTARRSMPMCPYAASRS